jgi:hypothetical protein
MQRARTNLITNAIEASPEGREVRLTLKTDQGKPAIMIKDQGVSVDRETLENVLSLFFQKRPRVPAWAWPSPKKSSRPTGGGYSSTVNRSAGRKSGSNFPSLNDHDVGLKVEPFPAKV